MKLWELLSRALIDYAEMSLSEATGGSTTTVIDTTRSDDEDAEDFENAVIVITRDAGGLSAAPEGELSRVSAYDPSTQTFTLASTLTAAVGAGDTYGVTGTAFNLPLLRQLTNEALKQLGDIPKADTSITTAAEQTEYTLPVVIKNSMPFNVQIQQVDDDANDNRWMDMYGWRVSYTGPNSTALLVFPQQPKYPLNIKIEYLGLHDAVHDFDDYISEYIHPELAAASLIERLANRYVQETFHSVPSGRIGYDKAAETLGIMREKYPIQMPNKTGKMLAFPR